MSDQVPNSISFKDLQEAMANASNDKEEKKEFTFEELCDLCAETKGELFMKTRTPLAMKMIALMILSDMHDWHCRMGQELLEDGDHQLAAIEWFKDGGQFQVLRNTLIEIEVTDQDPTPSWKQDR